MDILYKELRSLRNYLKMKGNPLYVSLATSTE